MSVATFKASSNIGDWAEAQISNHYTGLNCAVHDLSSDPFFQVMDIDMVVGSPLGYGPRFYVEVKGDTYTRSIKGSLNVYIETMSNVELGSPGCLTYTCADFIIYYFVNEGFALSIPVKYFREWLAKGNLERFPLKTTISGGKYHSQGRPVPVEVIIEEIDNVEVIDNLPRMDDSTK